MTTILQEDLQKIKERLEQVELEFQAKEKDIIEKTQKFSSIDQIIEDAVRDNDNLIKINIGGKTFTTRLSILVSNKDTLFYNIMFKYAQSNKFPKEIFFDRNYTHFPVIMEYLRYKKLSLTKYTKYEKEEIKNELEFYGIDLFSKMKKIDLDIEWDGEKSKSGMFTIDSDDRKLLKVHTTNCYTHFVTNRVFTDENFVVEFQSNVKQSDNYFYLGILNEKYVMNSNCGCCNPSNAYYIQKDGTVHIDGVKTGGSFVWFGYDKDVIIGMKVLLSERVIYFYKDSPENEIGPFNILNGDRFTVYAGHCNSGNGELLIKDCYLL